jgi:hypothetical protein
MLILSPEASMKNQEKRLTHGSDILELIERSNRLSDVSIQLDQGARRTSMHLADLEQRSAAALAQSEQVQQRYTHTWPASSRFSHARQPTRHI